MTTPTNQIVYHDPWTTYIHAREEARRRGDRRVGTEHLLLGLLQEPEIARVLGTSVEAGRNMLDYLDREAVASLGIGSFPDIPPLPARDVPARPTVKAVFKDRLPMTPAAKLVLQEAAEPMRRAPSHHRRARGFEDPRPPPVRPIRSDARRTRDRRNRGTSPDHEVNCLIAVAAASDCQACPPF